MARITAKTLGALSVTGREKYRTPFEPLIPGVTFVPYNDLDAAASAITDQTAALIIEPIQGEGGIIPRRARLSVRPAPPVRRARPFC